MSSTPHFRLIDHGWKAEFESAGVLKADDLLIVSPFIKLGAVKRLRHGKKQIRVLTRYSLREFLEGVSDLSALQHLLDAGAEVRGIKHLHAKLYVFGGLRCIVTSANLTEAALTRNHELGFISDDAVIIESCKDYFETLWNAAGKSGSLDKAMIEKWRGEISPYAKAKGGQYSGLRDYGADLGFMPDPPPATLTPTISSQAFVKFFGKANDRADPSKPVIKEIERTGSHWALSYPNGKRPRQPETGDVMFISTLVGPQQDMLVYGRAIAYRHQPGRDDASADDIRRIGWKNKWGRYIRVRDPEFVDGTLANGISFNQLMAELGSDSFASTAANTRAGEGNTDPRKSVMQKAHMLLSESGATWLNTKFYQTVAKHGRIQTAELEKLHWPDLPSES